MNKNVVTLVAVLAMLGFAALEGCNPHMAASQTKTTPAEASESSRQPDENQAQYCSCTRNSSSGTWTIKQRGCATGYKPVCGNYPPDNCRCTRRPAEASSGESEQ
jgi:hypothetical protein